jgi:T5orf172 domain
MAETIVTYVISYPGTNLVKIGQAKYFVDRFAQLKTGSPVDPEVLCVFRGSKHEREFHKKFDHLRHHGEFYHYTAELKAHIFSDALADHRLTRAEAEALSPRIERNAERLRREKRDAETEAKAAEMEPSLETDE